MLACGQIFEDRYRIDRVLGKGGMGTVFLAYDITDNSRWAIKEQIIGPRNRKLLISEAEIMSKLHHPALPAFRLKKEIGDLLYLVMEYIDGRTLEDIVREEGRIDEARVTDWFTQICEILVYLHGLPTPVVYRDLKPANIMLEDSGRIRIIDFGIAQQYVGDATKAEVAALTRGYAAPEQYDPKYLLDVRTDIYALAVTMHYLLTGKNPQEPPYIFEPVRKLRSDASPAIEAILTKCLQHNPDDRYKNASELLDDLVHIREKDQKLRREAGRKKVFIGSAVAVALLIAALIGMLNFNRSRQKINLYYKYLEEAGLQTELEPALQKTQEAILLAEDNPDAYIQYADTYIRFGMPEEAAEYIEEVIVPKFPDIYSDQEFQNLVERLEN
ncbi:MAG: serine/threonine protein kinase [Solobacterium sp.]|nr:serine/threonine protein kinase [Solobacterium sp.]